MLKKISHILKTQDSYFKWRLDRIKDMEKEYPEIFKIEYKKVLDIGCGAEAPLSYYLSEKKIRVFGGDINTKIVSSGKKFAKDANLIVFVAEKLPFKDEEFDIVYMFDVLEHIKVPLNAIREAQRVTKKGGYIFIEFSPYWAYPTGHHLYSLGFPKGLLPFQYIPKRITKKIIYNSKIDTKDTPELLFDQFDNLNKISIGQFRKMVDTNKSLNPVRYKANIMSPSKKIDITAVSKIPFIGELMTMSYSCLFLNENCHNIADIGKLPFVSFIIPTYNAEKFLENCLKSIKMQDYPEDKIEILIIDGGSEDNTLDIAHKYGATVLDNPHKNAENGKFIGISYSKGEIIILLDSDNEIAQTNWLSRMVVPLILDKEIIGVEYQYLIKDDFSIFNRYFARIKIVDPLARLLASRPSIIDNGIYLTLNYEKGDSPVTGANGFLWRKNIISSINKNTSKFEESIFPSLTIKNGFTKFAAVPGVGIYHYYSDSFKDFIKKREKIGNKFMVRKKEKFYWMNSIDNIKLYFAIIYCATIIGPLLESIYQFIKTRDISWFLHPIMSLITVLIYGKVYIENKMKRVMV